MSECTYTTVCPYAGEIALAPLSLAERAAVDYLIDVEQFDRTLDGYWSVREADTWIPIDRRASVAYARRTQNYYYNRLIRLCDERGIDVNEVALAFRCALDRMSGMLHSTLCTWIEIWTERWLAGERETL